MLSLLAADGRRSDRQHVGSEYIGWLRFQPMYEDLLARHPEMFG